MAKQTITTEGGCHEDTYKIGWFAEKTTNRNAISTTADR